MNHVANAYGAPIARRDLLGAGVLALTTGAAAHPASASAASETCDSKLTALHQEMSFPAPPARVYAALTTSAQFATFTGLPAQIDARVGGTAYSFGRAVLGVYVELLRDQRIVQAWRLVEKWPSGVYSVVKIELQPKDGGTGLVLDHTAIPEGWLNPFKAGWVHRWWEPLRAYLAANGGPPDGVLPDPRGRR